jgi:hypothetical protein
MSYERALRELRTGAAVALVTLVSGCASINSYQPPSTEQIAAAEAAVDAARKAGAVRSDLAVRQLREAEEQLATGKQAVQAGDNRTAVWSLAKAEADAELSQCASRQARQEAEAQKLEGQLAETRAETARKAAAPQQTPATP